MSVAAPVRCHAPYSEQRAHQVAESVLRNLKASLFESYPELGIEKIHAIVEDAAREA